MTTPLISIDGQSNADGTYDVASTTGYPGNGYHLPYANVQMMEQRANDPVDPPVWSSRGPASLSPRPGGTAGLFGVELRMLRDLDAAGYRANCVKTSIRGSGLYNNWGVNVAFPTSGPNLCAQHITHVKAAELAMGCRLAGFVRLQGEADAGNAGGAAAWATNEIARITRLREEWPNAWVLIVLNHSAQALAFNATVRAQQMLAAAALPRVRVFDPSAHTSLIGAHYDANSTIELGRLLALEVQALWTPTVPRRKAVSMYTFGKSIPIESQRTLQFLAVDENDLQSRLTSLSAFTVRIKKPGSVDLPATHAPTEVSAANMPGVYELRLSTGEIDTPGYGTIRISHSGMETRESPFCVQEANYGQVVAGALTPAAFTTNLGQVDNHWRDALIRFLTGGLAGQVKKIGAFATSGGLITLSGALAFTGAPSIGDVFELLTA